MRAKSLIQKMFVFGVSAACCLALVGCGGGYGYTGGVAATVNGSEIQEDTITKYIQDYRTSADLTDKQAWANWLNQQSLEPSSLREQVINYYVEQELVKQAANEQGVTVDSAEVDKQVEDMRSNYDSDDAWKTALQNAGITEEQYRQSVENGLLEKGLQEKVITEEQTKISDEDLLATLNSYSSMLNGAKRSSHILFSAGDESTANEVLEKIKSGELSFEDAAKQYSTDTASAEKGGDVGWDVLANFVTAYTDALDGLKKGEMSGLVTSDYGIHIIKCTDEFTLNGEASSLDEFPSEIVDYMRSVQEAQQKSAAFSEWLENYRAQAEIIINDMPSNVPYNVDMSTVKSTSSESSADGEDANTEGEASSEEGSSDTGESPDQSVTEENPSADASGASDESSNEATSE